MGGGSGRLGRSKYALVARYQLKGSFNTEYAGHDLPFPIGLLPERAHVVSAAGLWFPVGPGQRLAPPAGVVHHGVEPLGAQRRQLQVALWLLLEGLFEIATAGLEPGTGSWSGENLFP